MTKIAELTDRAVILIGGSDARAYLQDLVTNDIDLLADAKPLWAGLLSAQGKLLFDMILFDAGDVEPGAVLADVAASGAEALVKRLTMYRLRRAVTVAIVPGLKLFAAWDGVVADLPLDPQLPALGQRWIADAAPTNTGVHDYARHRRSLGVADSADLMPDKLMWLEANAVELNGVSFTKGCYVGQENTARMYHRDKLRRRLLPVRFDGDAGDGVIMAGTVVAGELRGHAEGRGIAYLKLDMVEGGAPLTVGGVPLAVDWPAWLPASPADS